MKRKVQNIYQFKITLKGINPPIWRRIQVPEDYSFWDLHCAITDAMGWDDYHLHLFEMISPLTGKKEIIGIPDDSEPFDIFTCAGWEVNISDFFTDDSSIAKYEYDLGDCWEHEIKLEKIMPAQAGVKYPQCVAGKRKCPPEDCGGVWGYEDFLNIIMDPNHERYEEMLEWAGGEFEPEHFDKDEIIFNNPARRLEQLFEY